MDSIPEDQEAIISQFVSVEDVDEIVTPSYEYIREEAVAAQKLAMMRLTKEFVNGTSAIVSYDAVRRRTKEKMFRISKLLDWSGGEPEMVYAGIEAGRLRCRLNAAMGTGKSVKLPTLIANRFNMRVLHVALDAHVLQQAGVYMLSTGIGCYTRTWTLNRGVPSVVCMTYADFNSHMISTHRQDLYKAFDLIVFDEAFVTSADVFCAKRFFSAYAPADTHLILCSATIMESMAVEDMRSSAMGNFKQVTTSLTLDEAINTGNLFTNYLHDRAVVFLRNNEQIGRLVQAYDDQGVDVRSLDDASSYEDLRDVETWLRGDSTVVRVLVAHVNYSIGYNLPINYVILFPEVSELRFNDDEVYEVAVPMTEEQVAQAKARTGRGIGDKSGGVIVGERRAEKCELDSGDVVKAFVKMCAGYLEPLRNSFWEQAYLLFPEGLSACTAQIMLKVCLPMQVVARYMASDGRVAAKYCSALNAFAHPNHFLQPSDAKLPISYNFWVETEVFDSSETIKVPIKASGELEIVLQAISLIADMKITVERWKPERTMEYDDGYDSEGTVDSRFGENSRVKLRKIEFNKPLPSLPSSVVKKQWAYTNVNTDTASNGKRQGWFANSERCRAALRDFEKLLRNYGVPEESIDISDKEVEETVPIVVEGVGNVESPGGSVVCEIPVKVCEKLNTGKELKSKEFVDLVFSTKPVIDRFVCSKLFDFFGGPWTSILKTLLKDDVVSETVKRGVATDAYKMVDLLRSRFNLELVSLLAGSNIFRKKYLGLFEKPPNIDEVMRAVRKGKFDKVAQTRGFFDRVKELKELIDCVLLFAEKNNQFLAAYITSAQRAIPVRGKPLLGYVGEDLTAMPESVGKVVKAAGLSRRTRSGDLLTVD